MTRAPQAELEREAEENARFYESDELCKCGEEPAGPFGSRGSRCQKRYEVEHPIVMREMRNRRTWATRLYCLDCAGTAKRNRLGEDTGRAIRQGTRVEVQCFGCKKSIYLEAK